MTQVKPDKNSPKSKKEQVSEMFDSISGKYDFLNHFFSFNIDKRWRKKAVRIIETYKPRTILDVATGTGDFAIALSEIKTDKIYGIDISEKMLEVGQQKIKKLNKDSIIILQKGDAENLAFSNDYFDAATVAFGVRNFENLQKGLNEICRVLKSGSIFTVLEFSKPRNVLVKMIYYFYFKTIMPFLGRLISKDKKAYSYLPDSVMAFPEREAFLTHLKQAGFTKSSYKNLGFGIVTLYISEK